MTYRRVTFPSLVALAALIAPACTGPSTPSGTPRASLTTPAVVSPAPNSTVPFAGQPLKLTVANATSTAQDAATYTFQVAADEGFANVVFTKNEVAAGSGGQTSVTIDPLNERTRYYWRAQVVSGGNGPASPTSAFTVGAKVTLGAPEIISPRQGGSVAQTPTLTVTNVVRSGPADKVFYRFEVAEDAGFGKIVYTATVPERQGASTTDHTLTLKLNDQQFYFWRARATVPAEGATGPLSNVETFKASKGVDLRSATIVIGPSNIADWELTGEITNAYFDPQAEQLCIFHTRLGVWPPTLFASDGTLVEGNQWVFANIDGGWIGGAADWYKPGQACKGLNAETIGRDAFYQTPNSPVYSWQPVSGEVFAVMSTTPSRAWPTFKTYDERTNVALIQWP